VIHHGGLARQAKVFLNLTSGWADPASALLVSDEIENLLLSAGEDLVQVSAVHMNGNYPSTQELIL